MLLENITAVVSGQSSRRSSSRSRRFVRKRVMLERTGAVIVGWGFRDEGGFIPFERKLRDLASEEAFADEAIMEAADSLGGITTWHKTSKMLFV